MSVATITGMLGALAVSIYAQGRPGIDRPIRVGTFIGTGTGQYWNESARPGNAALGVMLAQPDSAGLGPDLIVPPKGFSFTKFGVTDLNGSPDSGQTEAFIKALDTLDVVYIGCFTGLGSIISKGTDRAKLLDFMTTKAYVGVNRVTDTRASWEDLDSIHGVQFHSHSTTRNAMLRRDSVAENDPDWKFLNLSLFQNGLDTTFKDFWFSWIGSGETIRAGNSLGSMMITVRILESTYEGGTSQAKAMGEDHPMSWGRRMREGGRVFYTAVGHLPANYLGGPENPRFLRRQIYNAILWTAKYDSLSRTVTSIPKPGTVGKASAQYRVEALGSALKVSWLSRGGHTLELMGIDGRRVARREGRGAVGTEYLFENLRPGVYALLVASRNGGSTRLIVVP